MKRQTVTGGILGGLTFGAVGCALSDDPLWLIVLLLALGIFVVFVYVIATE